MSERQTITVTDIISEGPIFGLVKGKNSVYLDNEPQGAGAGTEPEIYTGVSAASDLELYLGSSSGTITTRNKINTDTVLEELGGKRLIQVKDPVGHNVTRREYPVSSRENGYIDGANLGTDEPPVGGYMPAFRRLGEDHDGQLEENWWPSHALTTGPRFTPNGIEGYTPVRLRYNSTGFETPGTVYDFTNSHWLNSPQYLLFLPRVFDGTNFTWTFQAGESPSDQFGDSSNYAYHMFFDSFVTIKSFDSETYNPSTGLYTYTVSLTEPWMNTPTVNVGTNSTHSVVDTDSDDEDIHVHKHDLETGMKVQYMNISGSTIGGLNDGQNYFVIRLDRNHFRLASTYADALAGVNIDLTSQGTGASEFRVNNYKFIDLGYDFSGVTVDDEPAVTARSSKSPGTAVQFRIGTKDQPAINELGPQSGGSEAVSRSFNIPLRPQESDTEYTDQISLQGTSTSGFGLTSQQASIADKATIRISYPAGLQYTYPGGNTLRSVVRYDIHLEVLRPGQTTFEVVQDYSLKHSKNTKNAIQLMEVFDLNQHRPFNDFKVKIARTTPDTVPDDFEGMRVNKSFLSGVTTIFSEELTHPFTALANIAFVSRDFQSNPKRTYHCRGKLVKVPSNYITREDSDTGVAKYTRDSSGNDTGKYVDWDGTFRDFVYTNNPAWIFYDLLTNSRYGLGDYVKETDVDKYALYRIARYCDEEVDDGQGLGNTEPRYTMNMYLQKSADAFKVLKDMCSNFVSVIYYLDGKIFPSQDSPAAPVYSFSKANVLDGGFTYEGTGTKTRYNQVIVDWNNPLNDYKLEPLLVEDRRDIVDTGKIISKKVHAYGCTSEGQATRYGKWKLWTAINQQEIASFTTGVNGSFITPGDIILIQDADREAIRFSGRISNTGTRDEKNIPIDSPITIDAGRIYEFSTIIQEDAAFLAQESATISFTEQCTFDSGSTTINTGSGVENAVSAGLTITGNGIPANSVVVSVQSPTSFTINNNTTAASGSFGPTAFQTLTFTGTYTQGDIVPFAYVGTSIEKINTSDRASNATASPNDAEALYLNFKPDFRVETKLIDKTATGTGAKIAIVLEEGLSSTPEAEDIWVVVEKDGSGNTTLGSGKEYKVLSISQNEKSQYDITAVEHYNAKYDAIEKDFQTYVPDPIRPNITSDDIVPEIRDATFKPHTLTWNNRKGFSLNWSLPESRTVTFRNTSGQSVSSIVEAVDPTQLGVHIVHDVPGYDNPLILGPGATTYAFQVEEATTYNFSLRTVNSIGNRSQALVKQFNLPENRQFKQRNMLPESVHYGGSSNRSTEIT